MQLNPLTASELCQHHSPWRPFWQVFGDSIGKVEGEVQVYTSNNVIPYKTALREIPLCALKHNFVADWAEVKDLQQARYTWVSDWAHVHWMGKCS